MAEDNNTGIHIGQLNLRIPGTGTEPAHRVAQGIVKRLAQKVPAGMNRRIGALSVRVHVPAGATEAEVSDAVTGAIVDVLGKGERRSQ